jgi:hypothetical protein
MTPLSHRLALGLLALTLAACASDWRSRFSFRSAAFLDPDAAQQASEAFLRGELPSGLARAEADRRLQKAGLQCAKTSGDTQICDYAWVNHAEGGTLGEDGFEVSLRFRPDGRLLAAALRRRFIGTGRPVPG